LHPSSASGTTILDLKWWSAQTKLSRRRVHLSFRHRLSAGLRHARPGDRHFHHAHETCRSRQRTHRRTAAHARRHFFSVSLLPDPVRLVSYFNPVFYLIDGFRYAVTGRTEAAPLLTIVVTLVLAVVFTAVCVRMFAVGYRLKD